ncbi:MAG: Ig-like domain-containing protein [Planctomycetes bacterium]|nr:Ig-like domain-containing protein [Planctomycetota bacterium]
MRAAVFLPLLVAASCWGATAPTMVLPSLVTISEDAPLTYITITGIAVASGSPFIAAYSGDSERLELEGAEFMAGAPGSAWVKVIPRPDANGQVWVFVQLFDMASGSPDPVLIDSMRVQITPVNDPPLLYATAALRLARGARAEVATANLTASDVDNTTLTFTLTQAPVRGQLLLDEADLAAGATFTQVDVSNHRLSYRHGGADDAPDSFSVTVSDGTVTVGPLGVGVTFGAGAVPFVGLPGIPATWRERGGPALVLPAAVVEDPDTAAMTGGQVTVAVVGSGQGEDRLDIHDFGFGSGQIGRSGTAVTYQGQPIGTVVSGQGTAPLRVALSGPYATPAAVQALLRAVTFDNPSRDPSISPRICEVVVDDGEHGSSPPVRGTWGITQIDDLPELPAGLRLATLPGLSRDLLLGAVDPDHNSNRPIWTVRTQPANAVVTMLDGEAQGGPKVRIKPTLPGIGSLELQVLDDNHQVAWTVVPVVVATLDELRPHPAADPPRTVVAGEAVDVVVPWDVRDLDAGAALRFSTTGSAPTGLVLTAQGSDRVRVTWPVPAATKAGTRYRFQVVAEDPVRGIPGFLPVDVLVTPRPAGSG